MTKRSKKTRAQKKNSLERRRLNRLHLIVLSKGIEQTTDTYHDAISAVIPVRFLPSLILHYLDPEPILHMDRFEEAFFQAIYRIRCITGYTEHEFGPRTEFRNRLKAAAPKVLLDFFNGFKEVSQEDWYFEIYKDSSTCNRWNCHLKPGPGTMCICGNPLNEQNLKRSVEAENRRLVHEARKRRKRLL